MPLTMNEAMQLHTLIDKLTVQADIGVGAAPPLPSPNTSTVAAPTGWTSTFRDDFRNGIDWSRWDSIFGHSDPNLNGCSLVSNNEIQWYVNHRDIILPDPWHTTDNGLVISATPIPATLQPDIGYDQADAHTRGQYRYFSGLLQNKQSFSQLYGRFEIECRMPAGPGLWPAFWLLPTSGNWPPEIDVFELLGHEPNRIYTTQHTAGRPNDHIEAWADFTSWHTIALEWEPDTLTLFIDGTEAGGGRIPNRVNEPMYMLINLAVGGAGSWPGAPDTSTQFPARFEVRRVEAFKRG